MAKEQPGIKHFQTLDPANRLPAEKYQYVAVKFEVADQDVEIVHRLNPVDAESVMYEVVRITDGEVVYQDMSPTRRPWQRNYILLRASGPCAATILLTIPSEVEELLPVVPQPAAGAVTPPAAAVERLRSFGITIDAGTSVITTGIKGFVRLPIAGYIQKVTVLSTDSAVTSGSIVVDVWKDQYVNYAPTVADSVVAAAPPTISSATKSEDSALAGWTRAFIAGDIFGFSVTSVTSLKRVTLIIDYLPT